MNMNMCAKGRYQIKDSIVDFSTNTIDYQSEKIQVNPDHMKLLHALVKKKKIGELFFKEDYRNLTDPNTQLTPEEYNDLQYNTIKQYILRFKNEMRNKYGITVSGGIARGIQLEDQPLSLLPLEIEDQVLEQLLNPGNLNNRFNEYINKQYQDRKWANDRFQAFLSSSKQYLAIVGGPGYGKSHYIVRQLEDCTQASAGYFFEARNQGEDSIKDCIRSLSFDLANNSQPYRRKLFITIQDRGWNAILDGSQKNRVMQDLKSKTDRELAEILLAAPLREIGNEQAKHIIMLDAIDEASFQGRNPAMELLTSNVFRGLSNVKVVFSVRDEPTIRVSLQSLDCEFLEFRREDAEQDIRRYLSERLRQIPECIGERNIEALVRKCDMSFLFAEKLCDAFENGMLRITDPIDKIPTNIAGLYHTYFRAMFPSIALYNEIRDALGFIAISSSITKRQLLFVTQWEALRLNSFYAQMRGLVIPSEEIQSTVVGFFHKTVSDWLLDEKNSASEFAIDRTIIRGKILDRCFRVYKEKEIYRSLSYEVQKYVYEQILDYGDQNHKQQLNKDYEFLTYLQEQAYKNSDFSFSSDIYRKIRFQYELASEAEAEQGRKHVVRSCVLSAEAKIASGNGSINDFLSIQTEFSAILQQEPDLYVTLEDNVIYLLRNTNLQEAEKRFQALEIYVRNIIFERKWYSLAMMDYHYGIILYMKGTEYFDDAESRLKNAVELANTYFSPREKENLTFMAQNMLAAVYRGKGDNDLALSFAEASLQSRISLFGEHSRYTSTGYDAWARAELGRAKQQNDALDARSFVYAEKALEIDTYIFGRDSSATARHLQTLALLYLYEHKNDPNRIRTGIEYSNEALVIYQKCEEARAIKKTKDILDELECLLESVSGII